MRAAPQVAVAGKKPGTWLQQAREGNGDRGEKGPAGKLQEETEADLVSSEDLLEGRRRHQCKLTTRLGIRERV